MGKKPLNERQVKSLRTLVKDKPLHELLMNLSVDLMLRSSDLLSLRVKDVMNESGSVKSEVKVKQKMVLFILIQVGEFKFTVVINGILKIM